MGKFLQAIQRRPTWSINILHKNQLWTRCETKSWESSQHSWWLMIVVTVDRASCTSKGGVITWATATCWAYCCCCCSSYSKQSSCRAGWWTTMECLKVARNSRKPDRGSVACPLQTKTLSKCEGSGDQKKQKQICCWTTYSSHSIELFAQSAVCITLQRWHEVWSGIAPERSTA